MRLDHNARLERLLTRHNDIEHVPGSSGNGTLIRKDQLLVLGRDADNVNERASRWIVGREDDAAGVSVLHLRPRDKVDVCELVTTLSGDSRHKTVNAGPNHVMTAAPGWTPGPFDDPTPVSDVPAPPADDTTYQREVTVAILDTGIAEHPWFDGRKWFAGCGADVREVPDSDADSRLDSVAGHGTFIAGVVLQQAPAANLVIERVIAGDGVTDELQLLRGLAKLRKRVRGAQSALDVISLSLGCYTHDDKPSPVLEHGLKAFDYHTVIVACAGNAASDRPYWPAALKRVVAVASLDAQGRDRAAFSNYGWWVDACSVGADVVSSFFSFDDPAGDGYAAEHFAGFASWSGTSFAAPRVAGAIAARAGKLDISAAKATADLLDASAYPSMPDLGVLVDVGTGRP